MLATLISGDRVMPGELLQQRIHRVAGGLLQLGLAPGSRVGLLMRNDIAFIEIMLAAEHAGLCAVALNGKTPADELEALLIDVQPSVLFVHADLRRLLQGLSPACPRIEVATPQEIRQAYGLRPEETPAPAHGRDYEAWLRQSPPLIEAAPPPEYRMVLSSGSTGRPKKILRRTPPADVAAMTARRTRAAHRLDMPFMRSLVTGPLHHSAVWIHALNSLRHGEQLVLQPKFDAANLLDLMSRFRITHLHLAPFMFQHLLALPAAHRERLDSRWLVAAVHGGGSCAPAIKRAMIDWWGPRLFEYYGTAEAGMVCSASSDDWLRRPGTVGRPSDDVEAMVLDESLQPVAAGVVGEVFVRSGVTRWVDFGDKAQDQPLRNAGWITLGDMGRLDAEGYLWLQGRKQDALRQGERWLLPDALEHLVLGLPGVFDCVAFEGLAAHEGRLVLRLSLRDDRAQDIAALKEQVTQTATRTLGEAYAPAAIDVVKDLPREDSGKLRRSRERSRAFQHPPGSMPPDMT